MDSALVKSEALRLSPIERAQLIDALWASLEGADRAEVEQAWTRESLERLQAFRNGQLAAVDGETALNEIEAALGR